MELTLIPLFPCHMSHFRCQCFKFYSVLIRLVVGFAPFVSGLVQKVVQLREKGVSCGSRVLHGREKHI